MLFLICVQPFSQVSALTSADYHQRFWGGGLNIWVNYPEEASPGDNINVNVYIESGKFSRGNQVEEVRLKLSVLTASSSSVLYDNVLLSNTYIPLGDTFNKSIPVTLPNDSRWYMTIQMDTVSYQQDGTNRQEAHVILDAIWIRASTYYDLEQQVMEIQAYSNQLDQKYNELKTQLDNLQTTQGDQLEKDYLELVESYIYLVNQYNQQLSYNQTTINPDTVNALLEMETMYQQLLQEVDAISTQLADTVSEKEAIIQMKDEEIEELHTRNQALLQEKDSIMNEFNEYQASHVVSQSEYDGLDERLEAAYSTRNSLIIITAVCIVIAIALYRKRV